MDSCKTSLEALFQALAPVRARHRLAEALAMRAEELLAFHQRCEAPPFEAIAQLAAAVDAYRAGAPDDPASPATQVVA